jgi:hypothetical protein
MTPSLSARRGQRAEPNALILTRILMAIGGIVGNRCFNSENLLEPFPYL